MPRIGRGSGIRTNYRMRPKDFHIQRNVPDQGKQKHTRTCKNHKYSRQIGEFQEHNQDSGCSQGIRANSAEPVQKRNQVQPEQAVQVWNRKDLGGMKKPPCVFFQRDRTDQVSSKRLFSR